MYLGLPLPQFHWHCHTWFSDINKRQNLKAHCKVYHVKSQRAVLYPRKKYIRANFKKCLLIKQHQIILFFSATWQSNFTIFSTPKCLMLFWTKRSSPTCQFHAMHLRNHHIQGIVKRIKMSWVCSSSPPTQHGSPGQERLNRNERKWESFWKSKYMAMARWLSWLEHHPVHQNVAGSIPVRAHT